MYRNNYSLSKIKPRNISDIIRIGNQHKDGGYIISKRQITKTQVLLGFGINDDWSFEEDFKRRNPDITLYCYDFSISKNIFFKNIISSSLNVLSLNSYTKELFNKRSPLKVFTEPVKKFKTYLKFRSFFDPTKKNYFFQKGVSDNIFDEFINIPTVFSHIDNFHTLTDNSIFVKIDIEESEYDILDDLLLQMNKINGFAIEFHNLKHLWKDFNAIIDKIKQDFEVVHVHGNNCCGYIGGTKVPNLIEVTFIKRSLLNSEECHAAKDITYPLILDRPNVPSRPDLKIYFE